MSAPPPETAPDFRRRPADAYVAAGVFALALIAGCAFAKNAPGLPLDDAYIHLTFARNLGQGRGFCFNPAEFSLGFSSPLWVMIMAAMQWLGADLVRAAGNLSMIFSAGSAALLYIILRASVSGGDRLTNNPIAALAALAFIACGNMLWLADSGMEASLFLFLGMCAMVFLGPGAQRPVIGGVALGLALLTRIEGAALFIVVAAVALMNRKSRRALAALAVAAVVAAPWFIFSWARTGFLAPPTREGKIACGFFSGGLGAKGIALFLFRHLDYLARFDRGITLLLVAAVIAGAIVLFLRRGPLREGRTRSFQLMLSPASMLIAWAVLNLGGHALMFRSAQIITPYNNLRYQVMLIPAVIAAAALALAGLAGSEHRRRAPRILALLVMAAALVLEIAGLNQWRTYYLHQANQLQKEHRAAAEWARAELPDDARIAALDIGVLGFYSGRYIIDLGGLIDPAILPELRRHRTGPYLLQNGATHYFHLVRHDSDRITGVKADAGGLYGLRIIKVFNFPAFPEPVFLHSFGIEIYEVIPATSAPPLGPHAP